MRAVPFRRWLVAALVASALAGAARAEGLPGSLPLRRDAEPASDAGAWGPSLLLTGLAVAGGGLVFWRRRGRGGAHPLAGRRGARAVTRLSSQALTAQASVHAVEWNGEELLLACTPQQVTLLARRPLPQQQGEQA